MKCLTCGNDFTPNRKEQKYCSLKCSQRREHKLNCIVCGKEFVGFSTTNKFCSKQCSTKYNSNKLRDKICKICGVHFDGTAGQTICKHI